MAETFPVAFLYHFLVSDTIKSTFVLPVPGLPSLVLGPHERNVHIFTRYHYDGCYFSSCTGYSSPRYWTTKMSHHYCVWVWTRQLTNFDISRTIRTESQQSAFSHIGGYSRRYLIAFVSHSACAQTWYYHTNKQYFIFTYTNQLRYVKNFSPQKGCK